MKSKQVEYGSSPDLPNDVRCKVNVWGLNNINTIERTFGAKLRATLFWAPKGEDLAAAAASLKASSGALASWSLKGRSEGQNGNKVVAIPPLSLLNAKSFTVEGAADLAVVEPIPGRIIFRWTCMYNAVFYQRDVDNNMYPFPYDSHMLEINVGVRVGPFKDVPLVDAAGCDAIPSRTRPTVAAQPLIPRKLPVRRREVRRRAHRRAADTTAGHLR